MVNVIFFFHKYLIFIFTTFTVIPEIQIIFWTIRQVYYFKKFHWECISLLFFRFWRLMFYLLVYLGFLFLQQIHLKYSSAFKLTGRNWSKEIVLDKIRMYISYLNDLLDVFLSLFPLAAFAKITFTLLLLFLFLLLAGGR